MTVSVPSPSAPGAASHDRGYHELRVQRVIRETAEASTFVLEIPTELSGSYGYVAGQFVTVRATIDGRTYFRSYSMCSAPAVDDELAVTVKRVPEGIVSNWMNDSIDAGQTIQASVPTGVFRLCTDDLDVAAFAAGSGVTPIFAIVKTVLATSERRVRLVYANRDRESVIFAAELDDLAARHPGRLEVIHHYDCDSGFVDRDAVLPLAEAVRTAECFVCGPAPFMDLVESALLDRGVPAHRVHIERFSVAEPVGPVGPDGPIGAPAADSADNRATQITIELDGQTKTTTHHPGATVLQTARQMGLSPPYSCESGSCATCMAKLLDGEVTMHVNDALFDDEVADGWILTCQSVPTTPTVHVLYGYEGT